MSHLKTYNIKGINCIWLPPRLVPWGFFLPCAGHLQLFRGHCAEEQPSAAGTLFRGGYICKDFLFAKDICEDTAHCHVITPDFFIGQCKVILDGKFFPMRCRPSPFSPSAVAGGRKGRNPTVHSRSGQGFGIHPQWKQGPF